MISESAMSTAFGVLQHCLQDFSRGFNDLRTEFRGFCMVVIWTIMGCSQLSLVSICSTS
jgi:hypothetical protein